MKAHEAARKIRATMKRIGVDSRGRVRVERSDYHTSLAVILRGLSESDREIVEDEIDSMPNSTLFDFEVI